MSVVIDPGEVDYFCGCVMNFMMFLAYFWDNNQDIITGIASSQTRSLQPIVLEGVVLQDRYTPHVPHMPYSFHTGSRSTAMTGIGACTPQSSMQPMLSSTTAKPNCTLPHQPPSQHF